MYNRDQYTSPTVLGIDEKWERVLCYLGIWVTGLIFLVIEQRNQTVRRHAMQSLVVFGTLSVLTALLGLFSHIPLIGLLFLALGGVAGLVTFVLWIILMIAAYSSPATFIGGRGGRYM
jgi:uncharacterized membrane protein